MVLSIRNNNPFSLLQLNPSSWRGLVGKEKNGFLKFDSVLNGSRAGFINLIQQVNKGNNTIEKIFSNYGDPGHEETYRAFVSKETGIPRLKPIADYEQLFSIGRAIVKMEAGKFWVDPVTFRAGLDEAVKSYQLKKIITTGGSITGILIILVFAYILLNR